MASAIMRRKMNVKRMRRRSGSVRVGEVETVYSTVVGEGRRVRRWGVVVSISAGGWIEALVVWLLLEGWSEVDEAEEAVWGSLSIRKSWSSRLRSEAYEIFWGS